MKYKQDWETAKNRLERFWEGSLDGCCLSVVAPRDKPAYNKIKYITPKNTTDRWKNKELRLNNFLYEFSATFYGGEAFPNLWVDAGPGSAAAFIGSAPHFSDDCIWFEHNKENYDLKSLLPFKIDKNCEWWHFLWELTEYFCENANGDYFVSVNDLGGTLDILASLRGTQQVLFDIMDQPQAVKTAVNQINDIWLEVFEKNYTLINKYMDGCSDWMNVWCHKPAYSVQCDIATMMSPDQYEEFVKPSIEKQVNSMDYSMYHLHMHDNPCLSAQLDMMLKIKNLSGIAFIPEPLGSHHDEEKWFPYYERIQKSGKKLIMFSVNPQSVLKLMKRLSPHGLHIQTYCACETDANDLLHAAKKYTKN